MREITLVTGRAGSGKSRFLRGALERLVTDGEKCMLIVPEQFTFETERELAAALGGGLMDVWVSSFTSLARRVLKETGERRVFLSRQGRLMTIRKAAEERAPSLKAFGRVYARPGFAAACEGFFTGCKRALITPEALNETAAKLPPDSSLRLKLEDLALLYGDAETHLAARNMDAEDAFVELTKRLRASSAANRHVMIDGFDLISEQLYGVLGALMDTSESFTVALRDDPSRGCRDEAVFETDRRIMARIQSIASERGLATRLVTLPAKGGPEIPQRHVNPALAHLEREAFAFPWRPYGAPAPGITIFSATDLFAEASAVGDAILDAADAGIRYRDMAVISTDTDAYMTLVGLALRARGIPFFTDSKHALSDYAASRLVCYALRCASRRFPGRDVLSLLKTGLTGVDDADAEVFENHILRYGIERDRLGAPFAPDAPEGAERARLTLMEPLVKLRGSLGSARGVSGKTEALYQYLLDIGLRERLLSLTSELQAQGRFELMEENAQVFNTIMELLTQLHAIMGDVTMPTSRYLAIVEEGLAGYEVGAIPTTADQVLFGSIGRTRARSIRALFILGASEGLLPKRALDDSFIDDAEVRRLSELGAPGLKLTHELGAKELSDVYGAISKPSERLYLSYPMGADAAGPAALIERIRAMFQGVTEGNDIVGRPDPASVRSGFDALSKGLRRFVDSGQEEAKLAPLYAAFAARPQYLGELESIEAALYHTSSPEPFGRELAAMLYGKDVSATRVESFNQCPFKHFARYGLKVLPRKVYVERRADEGTFVHEALERFTRMLMDDGRDIALLTREDVNAMLEVLFAELIPAHNNGVFESSARMRALCARLLRRIEATAWAVTRQLGIGSFRASGTEVAFGHGGAFPPIELMAPGGRKFLLSGKIDRLDTFIDPEGGRWLRVVDYKSGATRFDYADIYYGLRLQLPLYIAAAVSADRAVRAAGMYYLPVKEPRVDGTFAMTEGALEEAILKEYRLSGITLSDARVVRAAGGERSDAVISARMLVPEESLDAVVRHAVKTASKTAGRIFEGCAETLPYRRSKDANACRWCEYKSLCGFDTALPGCAFKRISRKALDDMRGAEDEVDR